MDFTQQNEKDRQYFTQDFSVLEKLFSKIRNSLFTGERVKISDLDLSEIIDFQKNQTLIFISLFQAGKTFIRYGNSKNNIEDAINRDIEMLRKKATFEDFDVQNPDVCRIMLEYTYDMTKTDVNLLQSVKFDENRFETGINGIRIKNGNNSYYYLPTDAVTYSNITLNDALKVLLKKTPIAKMTKSFSQRTRIFKNSKEYECFIFKSRAFVSYKNTVIPLYRGNVRYFEYNQDVLYNQILKSGDWLIKNMYDDGRFLYYYDCAKDNLIDHEHPNRKEDNLYYNDLRHCGGAITLIRLYQITKDKKYFEPVKKALQWSISTLKEQQTPWGKGYYAFYNKKAKLGGSGVMLSALMMYYDTFKDNSFNEFIVGLTKHLISRVDEKGEFLGYYIHPSYNDGKPLDSISEEEKKQLFSFYYPGEALLGLALFVNNFNGEEEFKKEVKKISEKALDWIVEERPKIYGDLFTALPSDAWLMQAIEQWVKTDGFKKENYINFVFHDADIMCEKTYQENNSPYIDYCGGMYYNYGDHYYPDGARCEGLIASYYLAKYLGNEELKEKYKQACKKCACCIFHLFNSEESSYSHKNPSKSINSIRFKATRQWVRVDSIQHVSCFFSRMKLDDIK